MRNDIDGVTAIALVFAIVSVTLALVKCTKILANKLTTITEEKDKGDLENA